MEIDNNNVATDSVDDGSDSPESQKPAKITYSPEQQLHLEGLLKDAQRRTARELRSQLEQTQLKLRELESRPREHNPEVEQLKSERDAAIRTTADLMKTAAIGREATRLNFIDPTIVEKLVKGDLSYDRETNSIAVVDDNGQPRLNSSLEPMTVGEYLADFANRNPFLVRGEVRVGGAGSTPSQRYAQPELPLERYFGKGSSGKLANDLAKADPARYRRMRMLAVEKGLL